MLEPALSLPTPPPLATLSGGRETISTAKDQHGGSGSPLTVGGGGGPAARPALFQEALKDKRAPMQGKSSSARNKDGTGERPPHANAKNDTKL